MQHTAHHGGGGGDPAAPFQVLQIIHRDPVAHMQPLIHHPAVQAVNVHACPALAAGVPDQQPLTQSGAEGVHNIDLPLGVLLSQLLGGNDGGLAGGGQGRGNGQHQHILPLSQAGRHGGGPALRVDGGGGGGAPPAQLLIEGFHGGGLGEIFVVFSVVGNGQGDRGHIQLLLLGAGEVTAGVGEDCIGVSHSLHTPINTVKMRRRKIPAGCRRHFRKTVLS